MRDLTGTQFGRWTVVRYLTKRHRSSVWLCRCCCGKERAVISTVLRNGQSKSCGCLQREQQSARATTHGHKQKGQQSCEYNSWCAMIQRCANPQNPAYLRYGGRGISVCARWLGEHGFVNFIADMGRRPPKMTLERKDNEGNYTAENCHWASRKKQANNRRTNKHLITFRGETRKLGEWAEILGLSYKLLWKRLFAYNWPVEDAFTRQPGVPK